MSHALALKSITILLVITFVWDRPSPVFAQTSSSVSGIVTEAITGLPLPHATAALRHPAATTIYAGSITDDNGRYTISDVEPGRYILTVSYVGFAEQQFEIVLRPGTTRTVDFALEPTAALMDPVIVTSSPVPEKRLDAATAVTVVSSEEIERDVTTSPTEILRMVPGVDMAHTGVDRRELVLRGFGKTFTGGTYVMTDYRQSAVASLGVNAYNMMPISSIDLDRIEVVRGPAGAVYGPGVDEGAIHFISKDPFQYPGTTIAISGGQQSMAHGELRHAGVIGGRLGYKVNAQYLSASDWRFDPSDPVDDEQIRRYYQVIPRDTDVSKMVVSGTAAYRFTPKTSLTGVAGYASAKSPFLSDIGALQSDGFGYRFAQLRLRSGRLFAQAYMNRNDAGDSFVYAGPQVAQSLSGSSIIDRSSQINLQAQYGLDLAGGREQVTFGVDVERTNPVTGGTINGRNEDEDRIMEYGVYAQSQTQISEKWNVALAGRLDYDNIFEQIQFSPRAALIFKPVAGHSIRATYNRAFASPGTNSLFLDISAREPDVMLPLGIRARGAGNGFTFAHDASFESFAGSSLIASSLNPETLGQPQPTGLPLDAVYGSIYEQLRRIPDEDLAAIVGIPVEYVAPLKDMLSPAGGTNVQGFTRGSLQLLDLTTGGFDPVTGAADIAPLKQTETQTFELGYKGLFGSRALVSIDAYYSIKEDFVRGLQLETPFVMVPQLRPDLLAGITDGIEGNAQLAGALAQFGITPEAAAALIVELASASLPSPTTPIAVVQPTENNAGAGVAPELMMTYRNFGRVTYYGLEAEMQVAVTERTTVSGSLSYMSDDFFNHKELGEENPDLFVSVNASTFKTGGGVAYHVPNGPSFQLAGRYVQGFIVRSGPYNGVVDDYFLLDAGAGYDFARVMPGLRLDVTVQNVFNHMHREFIGAPKIGRMGLARITYMF